MGEAAPVANAVHASSSHSGSHRSGYPADPGRGAIRTAAAFRPPRIGRALSSSRGTSRPGSPMGGSPTRVSSLSASICNGPETDLLLARVPGAGALREKLMEPLLFQHWDEPTQRAIWIASDGTHVRCVTVTGLSALEMADMWANFS